MIRILEVLATLKRAGAEAMVSSLVCGLDRSRFEPGVVTLFDASPDDLEPVIRACGVPLWRLGKRPGFDGRMYRRLRAVVNEFRPHVIHTHSYVLRYTLPVASCAMVHTVHNLAEREVDGFGRWIHRLAYARGVRPVAVASEVARSVQQVYAVAPVTIPNGIDTRRFRMEASRDSWRSANGFSADAVLIVSAARLEPQKNPQLLVEAFRVLSGECRLLLAGDGSLRPQLEGLERVHVLGVRTDLPELFAASDIFALASDWEGHPIALMEAMAAGLPVVATAVGGVPEIIGDAGILVPPREPGPLYAALHELAGSRQRREEFGLRARERAQAFDVSRMVEAYSALFEQVVRR